MEELSDKEILLKKNKYPEDCFDESHNYDHCLHNDTKLVIIGTITPKGFDYFYCAQRNKIFGYIVESIGSNLKELRQKINATAETNKTARQNIVDDIKQVLITNKIAFIDIMKYVIRYKTKVNSHDDKAIEYYSIDDKTLGIIKNSGIIICNNRLSQSIVAKKFKVDVCNINYIPQRGKGSSKENWVAGIRKHLVYNNQTINEYN